MINMVKVKHPWDLIPDNKKQHHVQEIIDFFHNDRNEEIGIIAAEELLDHFLQTVGLELYNQGIQESMDFLEKRLEDIKIDMGSLLKQ